MKSEVITMYLPIFREKLQRLEASGMGSSAEARRLKRTIRKVESAAPDAANALVDAAA